MAGRKLSHRLIFFIIVLLAVNYDSQVSNAAREVPSNKGEASGTKKPADIDAYFPIVGKVTFPTFGSYNGRSGSGSNIPREFLPGIDDTFVPNPGYEIPLPGSRGTGSVPTAAQP